MRSTLLILASSVASLLLVACPDTSVPDAGGSGGSEAAGGMNMGGEPDPASGGAPAAGGEPGSGGAGGDGLGGAPAGGAAMGGQDGSGGEPACVKTAWYEDADGDGYGVEPVVMACDAPEKHVAQAGDCQPSETSMFPGADETCDGIDGNCNGVSDDLEGLTPPAPRYECLGDQGWVLVNLD